MLEIKRDDISKTNEGFVFNCVGCNREIIASTKSGAIRTITRGSCRKCSTHYKTLSQSDTNNALGVYKNTVGKWCSTCSKCGKEQPYTRVDHARQSAKAGKLCRQCAHYENKTRPSLYKGFLLVHIDVFQKTAVGRGLSWKLDPDDVVDLWESQKGLCALSGLPMQKNPKTWSIDRIDNDRGYTKENIHLVLTHVNMMKGKYSIEEFIQTAKAIAAHNA